MPYILVLYYSLKGSTKKLAEEIGKGVLSIDGIEVRLRTVPQIGNENGKEYDHIYATTQELADCVGLAVGSPTRFGNMAAPLKYFLDGTSGLWLAGNLVGKPACVFTSSGSMHGGQESTLLSMMIPLMHHGMIMCGVPYSVKNLNQTKTGGTPYGPSHVARDGNLELDHDEILIARGMGSRLAEIALKLSPNS